MEEAALPRRASSRGLLQQSFKVLPPLPALSPSFSKLHRRSAATLQITWEDITLDKKHHSHPVIKEKLRETLGLHTCDRRSSKSTLRKTFPDFRFEKGFAENDPLYDPDLREPNDARDLRLREALEEIMRENKKKTYLTISSHSGSTSSMLKVIGHREFRLPTGAMIPAVVKVEYGVEPESLVPTETPKGPPECREGEEVETAGSVNEEAEVPSTGGGAEDVTSGLVHRDLR
jgi:hypothetical protein